MRGDDEHQTAHTPIALMLCSKLENLATMPRRAQAQHKCEDNIIVECDLCAFQIAAQVAFAQPPGQVCLRFRHGTVDGSIVVFTFVSFMIAAR